MISTIYGNIQEERLKEFQDVSGNVLRNGEWVLISEQVEHYQLENGGSSVDAKKWKKKEGKIPIRDLNFQYAYWKTDCHLPAAIAYAKEKLFSNGTPVYLPDVIMYKSGAGIDPEKKPKGYSLLIEQEKEAYQARN